MKVDRNKMDQVKKLSGAEFDRAFAQVLKNDHDHMAKMVRDHKGDLKAQALQSYADQTLPVLEQHKDMADKALSK
jgi:putative membrane protein